MKKKTCYICGYKLNRGIGITLTDYEPRSIPILGFKLIGLPKRYYICAKCVNTWATMVRQRIAIKTSDILK